VKPGVFESERYLSPVGVEYFYKLKSNYKILYFCHDFALMESEEDNIQSLLEWFNLSPYIPYNDVIKIKGEEFKQMINRMHAMDFIEIQTIGHYGGGTFISLTTKGRSVLQNGGYKKYLKFEEERKGIEQEKENREKRLYENSIENLRVGKNSRTWVIVGVIIALLTLLLSILWHYS
jgi:hypothetical protein